MAITIGYEIVYFIINAITQLNENSFFFFFFIFNTER